MSEQRAKYEIIQHEGKEARFYPQSGAIFDNDTGKIVGNIGGRPGMADGIGREIVEKRWGDVRQAIIEGLADAATELNVGTVPTDMLAEIVKARAITAASSSGKAGNDAARFIFTVVGTMDEGGERKSAAMEIKMSEKMAEYIMDKMIQE